MSQLKIEMQQRWNNNATSYDNAEAHGINNPWAIKRWKGLFSNKCGETLLDVGCGTGFVTVLAAQAGLAVTALDWSESMMAQAKEKVRAAHMSVTFVQGDIDALPFKDDTFQNVSARHVIWTLTDPMTSFKEWHRVLRPGGTLLADYSPRKGAIVACHYSLEIEKQLPFNKDIPSATIVNMLEEAGFGAVHVDERSHTHPKTATEEESIHTIYQFTATK